MSAATDALTLLAKDGGVLLKVRAAPGAKVERVVGVHGDALKVAVQAPPEKGRANERILALLADALGLAQRSLSVASGATARDKTVRIMGLSSDEVRARLASKVS